MHPLESASRQMEWAAANMAYNLDFIPDDKLDWKPAPTAPSALEVVQHVLGVFAHMESLLKTGSANTEKPEPVTTRDDAKEQLIAASQKFGEAMRNLQSEELGRKIETGFGTFPLGFVANMPVSDVLHHHGQIAYIQMLLGDEESHFDLSLLPS